MFQKKLSLLETTISLFILTIALLALMAAISVKFRLQRNTQETQTALHAAKTKLQEYLQDPFLFRDIQQPTFKRSFGFLVPGLQPQDEFPLAGEVQINSLGESSQGIHFLEIIVIVRWKGVSGSQKVALQSQRFRTALDELILLESR